MFHKPQNKHIIPERVFVSVLQINCDQSYEIYVYYFTEGHKTMAW
jgi:hypothetical protein